MTIKKAKKLHGVSQNTRLVIDLFRDDPVLYDKKCKDYGNQVATKKVFSPILVKFKNTITIFFNPELFAAMLDL